ncbi:hypothetical protein ANCDUO_11347 [Ancylostoma duodenale]|uniref:Uncharacterized protein n=1 Tax=Ancylostoma duodenale TaxID=51022 RepID=A0A0C2D8F3_9BILA|nr:hypothetical protein ANCDUO_11347 [Ancylostoma duodenale]
MWLALLLLVPRIKCERKLHCAEGIFKKPFTEQVLELKKNLPRSEQSNHTLFIPHAYGNGLRRVEVDGCQGQTTSLRTNGSFFGIPSKSVAATIPAKYI